MMKHFPVLVAAITLCVCNSVSAEFESFEDSFMENLIPGNNSHYVEGQSNYIWMPDGHGVPHLVNLTTRPSEDIMMSLLFSTPHGVNNQYWLYTRGTVGRNKVGRITGLDPAGPMFSKFSPEALHATDAQYVECIHTDGGVLGIFQPIGQVNFYPNFGRNAQPGCWISTCSHGRAYQLMAASIYHDSFTTRRCTNLDVARNQKCDGSDKLNMGNADSRKRGHGIFGVQTTDSWPFYDTQTY